MKLTIAAYGIALYDEIGFLRVDYAFDGELTLIETDSKTNGWEYDEEWEHFDKDRLEVIQEGSRKIKPVITHLVEDQPLEDIPTAWLKLQLLSMRYFKPNELNLENIFEVMPNLVWGQNFIDRAPAGSMNSKPFEAGFAGAKSVDKFPPMTDYVVPSGVRIADTARVRLGAYLGEGTTVMHEGFVNYNAGTEGPNMIEGRISSGVFIGKDTDLGGGSSTMGTLSGGNEKIISVGERCLLGANSGIGISLGNDCTVEAGLYLTAGTKVTLVDNEEKIVKALELSGKDGILYYRDSLSGKVCAKVNNTQFKLNKALHENN